MALQTKAKPLLLNYRSNLVLENQEIKNTLLFSHSEDAKNGYFNGDLKIENLHKNNIFSYLVRISKTY